MWVAREASLLPVDPVVAALDTMADIVVRDRLPAETDGTDSFDALVVCARNTSTPGFAPADSRSRSRPTSGHFPSSG